MKVKRLQEILSKFDPEVEVVTDLGTSDRFLKLDESDIEPVEVITKDGEEIGHNGKILRYPHNFKEEPYNAVIIHNVQLIC